MAVLLGVSQLEKSFGARSLFRGLTFSIEEGERVGLVGPNGVGKSTLLKILAGLESADEGQVTRSRGLRLGYLAQEPDLRPEWTVQEALESHLSGDDWEGRARVPEIASRLGLDLTRKVGALSGGWQKRVALGRELALDPQVLLLDEPTNHLDLVGIRWLEDFLAEARFASVTITHDRLFLERVANRILEVHPRYANGILSVSGGYARFVETQASYEEEQRSREQSLRNVLRRETEWLRRGAKARTTKQQARIQRAGALADTVDDLSQRNRRDSVRLDFGTEEAQAPQKLIEAKGISKSYEGRGVVVPPLDLRITPKTRLGLLGKNGAGKSTLIRLLLGQEKPDSGEIVHSERLRFVHFEQDRGSLDPEVTLLKTLCPTGETVAYRGQRVHVRSYLNRFLFTPSQLEMPVGRLSGGEQARLLIARLMLEEAHLLVLDEPTNDLDFQTLDLLMEALETYPGAVLLVSHDRYFLDQVSRQLLAFVPGEGGAGPATEILPFADYYQWEAWSDEREKALQQQQERGSGGERGTVKPSAAGALKDSPNPSKKRLGFKEQREWEGIEGRIAEAEARLKMLEAQAQTGEVLQSPTRLREVMTELSAQQETIEALYARWAELEALVSG